MLGLAGGWHPMGRCTSTSTAAPPLPRRPGRAPPVRRPRPGAGSGRGTTRGGGGRGRLPGRRRLRHPGPRPPAPPRSATCAKAPRPAAAAPDRPAVRAPGAVGLHAAADGRLRLPHPAHQRRPGGRRRPRASICAAWRPTYPCGASPRRAGPRRLGAVAAPRLRRRRPLSRLRPRGPGPAAGPGRASAPDASRPARPVVPRGSAGGRHALGSARDPGTPPTLHDHRPAHHPPLRHPGADRRGPPPAQRGRGPRHRLLPGHGRLHDRARHGQPAHPRDRGARPPSSSCCR